jgi:hypothetical protein
MKSEVELDYELFARRHPGIKNPTDINKECKFNFAMEIGWKRFHAMQNARKASEPFSILSGTVNSLGLEL